MRLFWFIGGFCLRSLFPCRPLFLNAVPVLCFLTNYCSKQKARLAGFLLNICTSNICTFAYLDLLHLEHIVKVCAIRIIA